MDNFGNGCFAVITGASQGLGRAFSRACAARGYNLFLADLPGTGLQKLAAELSGDFASGSGPDIDSGGDPDKAGRIDGKKGRKTPEVVAVECDLASGEGQSTFLDTIRKSGRSVSLLINNVGTGANGLFSELPCGSQRTSVDLNIGSTLSLTYGLIPSMTKVGKARIITVASLAAYYPMPLFAVYASTKAFLLNWSIALRHELADSGIGVSVLAPGGIYTSEELRRKVQSQGLAGRLSTMEPETVARIALSGAEKNRAVIIPGVFNKVLWFAGKCVPGNLVALFIHARWKKALSCLESGN